MSKKNQKFEASPVIPSVPTQAAPVAVEVDWAAIEALEKKARDAVKEPEVAEVKDLLSFEDWWMLREAAISKPKYYKEILLADFKARGLEKKEHLERWDWAGKQFGLKW